MNDDALIRALCEAPSLQTYYYNEAMYYRYASLQRQRDSERDYHLWVLGGGLERASQTENERRAARHKQAEIDIEAAKHMPDRECARAIELSSRAAELRSR